MKLRYCALLPLLAFLLVGCRPEPLTVRYEAERQLWRGRQLERRISSQPEAAAGLVDEGLARYEAVLERFPLSAVAADSSEHALLGQIRGNAALGIVRIRVGLDRDPEVAITTLEAIRNDTPDDVSVTARIYAELLRLQTQFGEPEKVVELLDEVVDRLPPHDAYGDPFPLVLEAPTQKAEILLRLGRETDARAELQVAHLFYDDIAEQAIGTTLEVAALLQKGNAYVVEERYAEADETMTRAREAKAAGPVVSTILQTQANLRQQMGKDPIGAIRLLQKLHREYPDDPRAPGALLQIGIAYRAAGLPDSALTAFAQVETLYPRQVQLVSQARFLGAKIYEATGRTEEAIRAYRSIATDFPRTSSGLLAPLELASLFEQSGNPGAAQAELQRAAADFQRIIRDLSTDPRESGTVLQTMDHLVDVWTRLGRWEDAVETLIGLAERYPDDGRSPLAYVRAATIQEEQLKDRRAAIGTLERLTTRYPDLLLSRRAAERIEQLREAS